MNKQDRTTTIQESVIKMNERDKTYFEEVSRLLRDASDESTRLTEARAEEALQHLARQILRWEAKGRPTAELLESDPAEYAAQMADDIMMRRPRTFQEKLRYYVMIPWVALTWVFFIYMLLGFFGLWFDGGTPYSEISSATLVMITGLSILLIELMTRFLGSDSRGGSNDKEETSSVPSRGKFNMKSFGLYIGFAVAVTVVGLLLGRVLPVFTVTPWQSLVLFVIGLAGQLLLLRRSR